MGSNDKGAKDLADLAGTQAAHAAKNSGRAAQAAAEPVAEGVRDATQGVLGKISSDTSVGILALSAALYSGFVAYSKFRQATSGDSHEVQ